MGASSPCGRPRPADGWTAAAPDARSDPGTALRSAPPADPGRTGGRRERMGHLRDRLRAEPPLARTDGRDLALARRHRDALVAAAVDLVHAAGHDPDAAPFAAARCGLADHRIGTELCAVAHALTRLADAPAWPDAAASLDAALRTFHLRLGDAADAVRACRQTAHPAGCWFTAVPGGDGCGAVLRLLHRAS
ncbi:hypothetical protein FTX61_08455 [Nitriliruptoraceae bacterium ZYF776]|nr:hypothetical protein [Profundirhabdus halotolerans]